MALPRGLAGGNLQANFIMAEERTLLEHLTMTCTTQRENVANEALCHILSSSPAARHALEDLLREGGANIGSIYRVSSQVDIGGKIPDLEAFDAHGDRRALLEGKFWAGLTSNQPVEYLIKLSTDQPTALLFVAPSSRSESLWPELGHRVREKGIAWEEKKTAELQSAATGGGRRLMLTSWRTLLDRMEEHARRSHEDETKANIGQLRGLTERMDVEAFLPLHPNELGPDLARRLRGLGKLVDEATQRASKEGWLKKLGVSAETDGYGRWVSLGETEPRLAISFRLWADRRADPLWLRFSGSSVDDVRRKLEPLRHEDPPGLVEDKDKGDVLVPISLEKGVEYDAVLNAMVARLRHITDLLGRRTDPTPDD